MDFLLHVVFVTANWVPITLAYTFLLGRGRIMNWGPVGVSAVAAYGTFATLLFTENYVLAAAAGLGLALAVSLVYAWMALRMPDDAFGVMSIAVHLGILATILNLPSVTRGALGIPRIPRMAGLDDLTSFTALTVLIALLWILLMWRIDRSALGRQLSALGEHDWHAGALGIRRGAVYVAAFLLLGAAIWTDNFLSPQYLHLLYPSDYQFPAFILLLTIVVAGRPGSFLGALLALVCIMFLREGLRFVPLAPSMLGPLRLILFGCILFVAIWWRRDKIFPMQRRV